MSSYIGSTGLSYLWGKIKSWVVAKKYAGGTADGGTANRAASIPFGKVDSTSTATTFTATVDGITELRDGICVYLMNGVVTSAAATTTPKCFTLNINGLGAKPVYYTQAAASYATTQFNINYTMLFVYNTTRLSTGCWDMFYGYDTNSNTIGYQLRTNSLTLKAKFKTYRYRLLFTSADGQYFVGANASTSTDAAVAKTPTTEKIDPFGAIVYYGTTTTVNANANFGATYLWTQYTLALGYSFNTTGAALTMTSYAPVYVKCTPQADGSAIIDSTTPYVQALPSTEDGKIYIFLGIAYSATNIELRPEHPVYYYKDDAIRIWTNASVPTKVSDLQNDSGFITGYTETDPVFSASAASGISLSDITNWNGKTSNTGTITSVKMNGSTVASSGEADLGTVITSHQDISGKADKVSNSTNGNFAALDSNGNLTDSGHKHSDYLTQHQDVSGKADKATTLAGYGITDAKIESGTITLGSNTITPLTSHQDITDKADKVTSAINGHLAGLNASGNLTDSGVVPSTLLYQGANQGTVSPASFDPEADTVHVTPQTLSSSQQEQARANINVPNADEVVYHGVNDGIVSTPSFDPETDTVHITAQTLSSAQQQQARTNIGAQETIVFNTAYNASSNKAATMADVNGKADKVVVVDASTPPASLDPNKVYQFGTLTGSITIPAFASVASGDTETKIWCFTFSTSSTVPTITWPAAITGWNGGNTPSINASKSYEVSVMDGIGVIIEA